MFTGDGKIIGHIRFQGLLHAKMKSLSIPLQYISIFLQTRVFSKCPKFGLQCVFLGVKVHILIFGGVFIKFEEQVENRLQNAFKRFYRQSQHILLKIGFIDDFGGQAISLSMNFHF